MMEFFRETTKDYEEVEALFDLSFAPGRHALSSYQLREGIAPISELSMICRNEVGIVIGAIRYWPVRIGHARALMLGPVAVHPTAQGEGIASILIRDTLDIAHKLGWYRVVLVGDAPYYSRYGFNREVVQSLKFPPPTNPDRFLGLALAPGAFDGLSGLITRDAP